jgi:hypothetical protein
VIFISSSSGKNSEKAAVTALLTYWVSAPSVSNTAVLAKLPKDGRITLSKGFVKITPITRSDQIFPSSAVVLTDPDILKEKGNEITDPI